MYENENSVCYTCHNYIHVFCCGIIDSINCPYLEYTIWKLSYMCKSMETFVYCIDTAVQAFLTMLAKGRKGLFWLTDLGWVNDGGKVMAGAGWGWTYFMLSQEAERDETSFLFHLGPSPHRVMPSTGRVGLPFCAKPFWKHPCSLTRGVFLWWF